MTTPKSQKPNKTNPDREKIWQIIEAIVIFTATWLNPQATIGILGLKLCFHILEVLRQPPK
jgi:arginine exporter protein ArgO